MTRWLIAFFVVVLVAGANVSATLRQPQEPPQYQATPTNDQRNGQRQAPSTSAVVPGADSQEAAGIDQGTPKPKWYREPQWIVAIFTGFIFLATLAYAIFAALQWRAISRQAVILERQTQVMEKTADAAKENADATHRNTQTLINLESPKIFVQNLVVRSGGYNFADLQPGANVKCTVMNYGRTPAVMLSYCMEFAIVDQLPEIPKYDNVEWLKDVVALEEREGTYSIESKWIAFLTEDQMRSVKKGITPLWVYGFVNFGDIFQDTWRVGFCYRWVERDAKGNSGFVPMSLPQYSYYTKE